MRARSLNGGDVDDYDAAAAAAAAAASRSAGRQHITAIAVLSGAAGGPANDWLGRTLDAMWVYWRSQRRKCE